MLWGVGRFGGAEVPVHVHGHHNAVVAGNHLKPLNSSKVGALDVSDMLLAYPIYPRAAVVNWFTVAEGQSDAFTG